MAFRDSLRKTVDAIRGKVPGNLGLRTFRVDIAKRSYSGARVGIGTPSYTWTRVLNSDQNPKVEEVSSRDVIASGGLYQAGDYRIGPFTPSYTGGGNDVTDYVPAVGADVADILILIRPSADDGGGLIWCSPVGVHDDTRNFRRTLVVRRTAAQPNVTPPV